MGSFNLVIPSLGSKFVDYRIPILGDSFNWDWVRPLNQVRYLVIHHAAGPDNQTPDNIAQYHVNHNGWGGIGYHFVITNNGTVYYVGDLTTARANVANMNEQVIGICLIGNFTGGKVPNDSQINSTHLLCAKLLFQTPELTNVNGWEDVVGHKQLGSTICPGDSWNIWRSKVITGISTGPVVDPQRTQKITEVYRFVLGRDPDQTGLQFYINSNLSIEQIWREIAMSVEHQQILNRAKSLKQAQTLATESITLLNQTFTKIDQITKL